jgi:lysozyme family protein
MPAVTPPSAAPVVAPEPAPKPAAPSNQANILDTLLILGTLVIIGGVLLGLFITTIPQANLPIIASLASALLAAVVAGYAGYRWGASDALKKLTASTEA